MKKIAIAALLSAIVAAPAFAADEGFYAGVTLGQARTNAMTGAALTKSNDTVYGILGGYQINKNFGAEAFYTGAGKWATTTASGKADAYGINAVGTLPLSDAFSLYAKLGYATTKSTASSAPAGVTGAKRNAATYGLGGTYNVTPAVGIRLGWDRYSAAVVSTGATSNYNSNVYSLAGVFKF
jgi:OmpA-OmpF porin, OOP family